MVRDYRHMVRGRGVWIPRWLFIVAVAALAFWFAARILVPPTWLVQQLDAPNSQRSARLYRNVYMKHHFVVKVKDGWLWQTAYYSPPLIEDLRIDLGERLHWSADSEQVWLVQEGQPVWGFDFEQQRNMRPEQLQQRASPAE